MKFNKSTLIWCKVYIDRARMYIGYINFLMLGFVFLHTFKDDHWSQFIFENQYYTYPIIIISTFFIFLLIGYFDTKLGLRKEELKNMSNANPVVQEILDTVRELKSEHIKSSRDDT
jgi:hypothetical protein